MTEETTTGRKREKQLAVTFRPSGSVRVLYPYKLSDLYAELNARYWSGQLPPVLCRWKPFHASPQAVMLRRVSCLQGGEWRRRGLVMGGGSHAQGVFKPPSSAVKFGLVWHGPARICIVSPLEPDEEQQVLLHEMIHCGLWFSGFKSEKHGPRFVAELERLAGAGESWATEEAKYYWSRPA